MRPWSSASQTWLSTFRQSAVHVCMWTLPALRSLPQGQEDILNMQSMTEAVGSSMRILVASVRSPADLMALAAQVPGPCFDSQPCLAQGLIHRSMGLYVRINDMPRARPS